MDNGIEEQNMKPITRHEAADMADAHAEGLHAELPREGCPECEDRPLRSYPREQDVARMEREDKNARLRG